MGPADPASSEELTGFDSRFLEVNRSPTSFRPKVAMSIAAWAYRWDLSSSNDLKLWELKLEKGSQ